MRKAIAYFNLDAAVWGAVGAASIMNEAPTWLHVALLAAIAFMLSLVRDDNYCPRCRDYFPRGRE